ncbi:MAG: transglutaminase-like domain-containing protein [Xenococcaceae cyanobacterium MO_207.B15]|nr:transglutaminase-like domain-containing protein [Xenococcaceae cyanobacterium MO_207.B15]
MQSIQTNYGKFPPLLLGITILFWGWQTELWFLAIPIALIIEGSRFIPWRWNLTVEEFSQVANLCALLIVIQILYLFFTEKSLQLIFTVFQWFPIVTFPLLAAQFYSTTASIDARALFFTNQQKSEPIPFDLTYPYFALCMVSASAGNVRNVSFYLGLFILGAIAIWFLRSPRFSPILWVCLLVIAANMGIVGHVALHNFHLHIERSAMTWVISRFGRYNHIDPSQKNTAIGDIGRLKLSNNILLRVKPDPNSIPPNLLRRVTYNRYASPMWIATNSEFTPVATISQNNWKLLSPTPNQTTTTGLTIATTFEDKEEILSLPNGSLEIQKLSAEKLEQNQYGVVQLTGEPGFVSYRVEYDRKLSIDSPPVPDDLTIPIDEKLALDFIIEELDLREKSPQEILNTIQVFFNTEFEYSLELTGRRKNFTPLSTFLLENRVGHCEYFATATTLLLRALGIPARYAIGYSVHEFNQWENQFVVRGRNAHAWTLVYIDGVWQEFDTTPSSWIPLEDASASSWGRIGDFFSLLSFKISLAVEYLKDNNGLIYLWLLVIPLVWIVIRWFYPQKQLKATKINQRNHTAQYSIPGLDSEIYLIETALKELGLIRNPSETWQQWLERLHHSPLPIPETNLNKTQMLQELKAIVMLHYRYRFDPQGLNSTERTELKSYTQSWLNKYSNQ